MSGYYPAIPEIAKAFENDPRTRLAQQMMETGSSTAPVAQGGYAWIDGLARALSGVAGGYMTKKQQRKYENDEKQLMDMYAEALGSGGAPGADAGGGGEVNPAPALPPQPAPDQMVPQAASAPPQTPDPLAPLPDQAAGPGAAPTPPQALPQAPQIAAALAGQPTPPQGAPSAPMAGPNGLASLAAMLPITATTESGARDYARGKPVTSPKGAKYAMQTMPGTARDPGYNIKPAQSDTPEEYNRVGREYLAKMMDKYGGDPEKAWAAYNAGPGTVDKTLRKHGNEWFSHLPTETQAYVKKNVGALGDNPEGGYYPPAEHPAYQQPPFEYSTPEPELPGMPNRPAARSAAQSRKLAAGQKLLGSGNRYAFSTGMRLVEDGMGEQFRADADALNSERGLDSAEYEGGLNNYYGAQGEKRRAGYDARTAERSEYVARGREERGYAHDDSTREDNQQFQATEAGKDRTATAANVAAQIEGRRLSAQEKRQASMQNFLNTPQGAKLYGDATKVIQQNDGISDQIDAFLDINAKSGTGGLAMNLPTGAGEWVGRNMNSNTQQMDAITNKIAPLMRQVGAGSMSDKDLARFERSVPNIRNTREANAANGKRLKAGFKRANDFEMHKLQSASEGRQIEFLKEWQAYKQNVPFESGVSFDEWKDKLPTYGADGKRK